MKPYRQMKIPKWAIVLLFFVNPPLAVILLIVSLIKIPYSDAELEKMKKAEAKAEETTASGPVGQKAADPGAGVSPSVGDAAGVRKKGKATAGEVIAVILSIIFAVASLGAAITLSNPIAVSELVALASYLTVSLASFAVGMTMRGRRKRAARYGEWIGDRDAYDLRTLSYASGVNKKRVLRDLRRLTASGAFGPKAFVDESSMMFYRSPDAAEKYKKDRDRFRSSTGSASDIEAYTEILMKIRRLNDEIADPEVSRNIDRIEEQTRYIFGYVSDHPEKRGNISTFMNYYLPTTLKLLESYAQLEKMGEGGENMQKSKEGIEGILTMLSEGFVRQTDQLFASESIEINSDIEVLETMMKKDGLTGTRDFDLGGFAARSDGGEKGGEKK